MKARISDYRYSAIDAHNVTIPSQPHNAQPARSSPGQKKPSYNSSTDFKFGIQGSLPLSPSFNGNLKASPSLTPNPNLAYNEAVRFPSFQKKGSPNGFPHKASFGDIDFLVPPQQENTRNPDDTGLKVSSTLEYQKYLHQADDPSAQFLLEAQNHLGLQGSIKRPNEASRSSTMKKVAAETQASRMYLADEQDYPNEIVVSPQEHPPSLASGAANLMRESLHKYFKSSSVRPKTTRPQVVYKELYTAVEMEVILNRIYERYTCRPSQQTHFNYMMFIQFKAVLVDCKALLPQGKKLLKTEKVQISLEDAQIIYHKARKSPENNEAKWSPAIGSLKSSVQAASHLTPRGFKVAMTMVSQFLYNQKSLTQWAKKLKIRLEQLQKRRAQILLQLSPQESEFALNQFINSYQLYALCCQPKLQESSSGPESAVLTEVDAQQELFSNMNMTLLREAIKSLKVIYANYFPQEMDKRWDPVSQKGKKKQTLNLSYHSLRRFVREFNLETDLPHEIFEGIRIKAEDSSLPRIFLAGLRLSQGASKKHSSLLKEIQAVGVQFKLTNFLVFLSLAAQQIYKGHREGLKFTLERMETSFAMKALNIKLCQKIVLLPPKRKPSTKRTVSNTDISWCKVPTASRRSLSPAYSQPQLNDLGRLTPQGKRLDFTLEQRSPMRMGSPTMIDSPSKSFKREGSLSKSQFLTELERFLPELEQVFNSYTSSEQRMSLHTFLKVMRDFKFVDHSSEAGEYQADLTTLQLVFTAQQGKCRTRDLRIDFSGFIAILKKLASFFHRGSSHSRSPKRRASPETSPIIAIKDESPRPLMKKIKNSVFRRPKVKNPCRTTSSLSQFIDKPHIKKSVDLILIELIRDKICAQVPARFSAESIDLNCTINTMNPYWTKDTSTPFVVQPNRPGPAEVFADGTPQDEAAQTVLTVLGMIQDSPRIGRLYKFLIKSQVAALIGHFALQNGLSQLQGRPSTPSKENKPCRLSKPSKDGKDGLFSFDWLVRLMKYLEVYPRMLSKMKLQALFKRLTEIEGNSQLCRVKSRPQAHASTDQVVKLILAISLSHNYYQRDEKELALDEYLFQKVVLMIEAVQLTPAMQNFQAVQVKPKNVVQELKQAMNRSPSPTPTKGKKSAQKSTSKNGDTAKKLTAFLQSSFQKKVQTMPVPSSSSPTNRKEKEAQKLLQLISRSRQSEAMGVSDSSCVQETAQFIRKQVPNHFEQATHQIE